LVNANWRKGTESGSLFSRRGKRLKKRGDVNKKGRAQARGRPLGEKTLQGGKETRNKDLGEKGNDALL